MPENLQTDRQKDTANHLNATARKSKLTNLTQNNRQTHFISESSRSLQFISLNPPSFPIKSSSQTKNFSPHFTPLIHRHHAAF
jgi:hypothetical protein